LPTRPEAPRIRPGDGRLRRRTLRLLAVLTVALTAAVAAHAQSSFSDPEGDANEAPDIASVTVRDSGSGAVTVRVTFANFHTLPPSSRILLRFDLDEDEDTGSQGDEVVVRYSNDGTLDFLRWDGSTLGALPTSGMTATFEDGVLEYRVERRLLGGAASFGLVAVAARSQQVGAGIVTSTDFAPGSGRHLFTSGSESFPDPDGDHDVAPDITSIAAANVAYELLALMAPDR